MLLHHFLRDSVLRAPEAPAILEPQRSASYAELDRLSNRVANALIGSGVRRGDRVVIALENSIEMVAAYLGSLKAGAVAVPLPAGPRSDRLAAALVDCIPRAAIVDVATAGEAIEGHPLRAVPAVFVARSQGPSRHAAAPLEFYALDGAIAAASDEVPQVRCIDQDLAAIIYTSGSTGQPRGVMLTHRNLVANARSIVTYLGLTERDRVMCVLPFYYVYGLSLLHTHLAVGASIVLDNRFVFPNVVLDAMRQREVTGFAGVPSTFTLLLHRSNIDTAELPHLRYVTQAGGGMPAARIHEWLKRGPKVPFYVMYGATEASARLAYLDPSRLSEKAGSIGRAIPNVRLVIVKDDGAIAGTGEVGELVAQGSNVARGYWNNPEETREKFSALGYRTGDLGYMDEDGFIFLVGRRQDMIKVGAHRVGAREIEDVLHEHPSVREAAVVSMPHELLGEAPLAIVVINDDLPATTEALRNFCHERLASHKVPVRFHVVPELPKIPGVGKIDKVALRKTIAQLGLESTPA